MSITLVLVIGTAVGIVILILMAMRWGRTAAEAKSAKSRLEAAREAKEIRNEVEALPDADRRNELGRFVRKPR